MRICLLSFHCCPFSLIGGEGVGGMNVYLKELSSALVAYPGVKIDIFTRKQSQSVGSIRSISDSLRVIHLSGGAERKVDRQRLPSYLPEFAENIEKFIFSEKISYDIIYSHYWLSGLAGKQLQHRFSLPLVHTFHTLGFLKKKIFHEQVPEERMEAEKWLAKSSNAIISSSLEEKQSIISGFKIPPSKIRVIYPGVNSHLFQPTKSKNSSDLEVWKDAELKLLYVGRIEPVKNLMSPIKALIFLRDRNASLFRRTRLVVIGGGEKGADFSANRELKRIFGLVEKEDLEPQVSFIGSKEQGEISEFYSSADALVVPSLYESFGLVVVEALACGTPVLVSRVGKMKSIVREGQTGFSFNPNDTYSLVECVEHFLTHKDQLWPREKIRQDVITRFSWDRTARETYTVFRELMERPSTTIPLPGESPQPV